MDFAPKWYRESYKQFVKDNPTKANEGRMKMIDDIDKMLEKGDIPTWSEALDEEFREQTNLPSPDE